MDVRQRTEEIEHLTFAPWATFSDASRGRAVPEPQDPLRPVFQRDRDRVLHCKAFRRLKQKTQVFLSPEGDLYRTRLDGQPDETQQYTNEGFARECFRLFDEPDSAELYSRIRLTRHDWETGTDEVLETLEF